MLVADEPGSRHWPRSTSPRPASPTCACSRAGYEAWRAAGLPIEATPDDPADADCIDFLFFTAARHDGDAEAAAAPISPGRSASIGQLDAQERGAFRI